MSDSEHSSSDTEKVGNWLGSVGGFRLHEPGEDAEGPILQIHGDNGMVAVEFSDEEFVEGLTHLAAEIQTVFDEQPLQPDTDRTD